MDAASALRIGDSETGIRVSGFGIRGRVCGVALSLNLALRRHKAAEDVAQVGALQARLPAVQQVQLRLRVQPPLALLGQADQHVEAGEHLLELGRGIGSAVQALLQQFGLGQVRSLTVEVELPALALQAAHLAHHQGGPSALEGLLFQPQPGDIFHLHPLERVRGTQGGQQVAEQAVVGARVLTQGEHALREGASLQAVLEGVQGHMRFALGGARPGGILGVAAVGRHLFGGGVSFLDSWHS